MWSLSIYAEAIFNISTANGPILNWNQLLVLYSHYYTVIQNIVDIGVITRTLHFPNSGLSNGPIPWDYSDKNYHTVQGFGAYTLKDWKNETVTWGSVIVLVIAKFSDIRKYCCKSNKV